MQPALTLIAARGRNGVIGRAGGLPWRLASDLAHFKKRTWGKPVLMGRATFDAIGRPLPGRANLVLTRDASFRAPGAWLFADLALMLAAGAAMAHAKGADEMCVIGGGALFAATMARADRLVLTEVDAAPSGDAVFPAFDQAAFVEVSAVDFPAGANDDHAFRVRELRRRA